MARRLYEQAAQQGNIHAIFELGEMYLKCLGVEQSYEKAFEYYEQKLHIWDMPLHNTIWDAVTQMA
jgi:hypothetical protein